MSGYTQTPNFGLYKPIVNGDDSQWGNHLNTNADIIDNVLKTQFLPVAGGTTGPLTVNGAFTVGIVDNSAVNFNFGGGGVVHISSTAWWPGITFEVNNTSYGQYLRTNRNGKNRWIMEIGNADPETGSNSGTNFTLMNVADDGATQLGTPLSISRATGMTTLGAPLVLPSSGTAANTALKFEAAYPNSGLYGTHLGINFAVSGSLVWGISAGQMNYLGPIINLPALAASTSYANDAAAATGGVAVGQLYRNGSVVQIRVT